MTVGVVWYEGTGRGHVIGPAAVERGVGAIAPLLRGNVSIVLPPLPELVVTVRACRDAGLVSKLVHPLDELGAIVDAHVIVTASAFLYRGDLVFLKERVDEVARRAERIVVVDRLGWMPLGATMDVYHEVPMKPGRDVWFPALPNDAIATESESVAPSLREIVADPLCLETDNTLVLYESYLEPDDAGYVGASGTSLGSRPAGRLS